MLCWLNISQHRFIVSFFFFNVLLCFTSDLNFLPATPCYYLVEFYFQWVKLPFLPNRYSIMTEWKFVFGNTTTHLEFYRNVWIFNLNSVQSMSFFTVGLQVEDNSRIIQQEAPDCFRFLILNTFANIKKKQFSLSLWIIECRLMGTFKISVKSL